MKCYKHPNPKAEMIKLQYRLYILVASRIVNDYFHGADTSTKANLWSKNLFGTTAGQEYLKLWDICFYFLFRGVFLLLFFSLWS